MRKAYRKSLLWVLAALGILSGAVALAQSPPIFPQTLPPNTVVGRLGAGLPGPAQAIPFASLFANCPIATQSTIGCLSTNMASSYPVFNVQQYGWIPDGTDRSTAMNAVLTAACATPPLSGGTIYFPAGGTVNSATVTAGSYVSGTGVVTLTTSVALGIPSGNLVTISGLTGTGSFANLNGTYVSTSDSGTTLIYNSSQTGLTLTITGGTVIQPAVYRADSQLLIPNDGAAVPHQCNLRFEGAGGGINWNANMPATKVGSSLYGNAPNASIVDLRYQSPTTRLNGPTYTAITPASGDIAFISNPLVAASTTGSISGTTLTVSSGTGIATGQTVVGLTASVADGTKIVSGGGTSWTVNHSQSVSSETMKFISGGSGYAANDLVVLAQSGGTQTAAASILVNAVDGNGAIMDYSIGVGNVTLTPAGGTFSSNPTSFTQSTTTGGGSGVVINSPTYTGYNPKFATWGKGSLVITGLQIIDLSGSNPTPFLATSNTNITLRDNSFVCTGHAQQDVVLLGGDQQGLGGEVNGPFQGYGSQITQNLFTACNRALWARQVANNWMFSYNAISQPTGQWALECNANFTAVGRAAGDTNLGAIVENNIVEGIGNSIGVTFFVEINACTNGWYSNNTLYDSGNYLYHPWNNAWPNIYNVPYAPTSASAVNGDTTSNLVSTIWNPSSTVADTSGLGHGSEVYSEFIIKGGYDPTQIGTAYPGGLIVNNGTLPGQYISLGTTAGHSGVSAYRGDLDAHATGVAGSGAQELYLNPSGGTVHFGGSIWATVRSSGSSTVSAALTDYFLCLDPTSNAITLNLPASPVTGLTFLIKDCTGHAATHNITVTPNSGNIDGSSTFVMSTNFQSVAVTYTGSQWSVN